MQHVSVGIPYREPLGPLVQDHNMTISCAKCRVVASVSVASRAPCAEALCKDLLCKMFV